MVSFYLVNSNGNVVEIRKKVKINNIVKYIIDTKSGIRYVSELDFNYIPFGYKVVNIK